MKKTHIDKLNEEAIRLAEIEQKSERRVIPEAIDKTSTLELTSRTLQRLLKYYNQAGRYYIRLKLCSVLVVHEKPSIISLLGSLYVSNVLQFLIPLIFSSLSTAKKKEMKGQQFQHDVFSQKRKGTITSLRKKAKDLDKIYNKKSVIEDHHLLSEIFLGITADYIISEIDSPKHVINDSLKLLNLCNIMHVDFKVYINTIISLIGENAVEEISLKSAYIGRDSSRIPEKVELANKVEEALELLENFYLKIFVTFKITDEYKEMNPENLSKIAFWARKIREQMTDEDHWKRFIVEENDTIRQEDFKKEELKPFFTIFKFSNHFKKFINDGGTQNRLKLGDCTRGTKEERLKETLIQLVAYSVHNLKERNLNFVVECETMKRQEYTEHNVLQNDKATENRAPHNKNIKKFDCCVLC